MQGPIKATARRGSLHPHVGTLAVLVALQTLWALPARSQQAPSQKPLISRDIQPAPNVMLTLDTSWSMIFPYIPEGEFRLPGGSVTFPRDTSPILHPRDTRYTAGEGPWLGDGGVITGETSPTTTVFQMQMRSPDVNALYYDPRVRYKPWLKIDPVTGAKGRFPDALPSKAFFDPLNANEDDRSAYADLTAAPENFTTFWCSSPPYPADNVKKYKLNCDRGTAKGTEKSFSPGLYYLLDSTLADCTSPANPNFGGCYKKFDINTDTSFLKYPKRDDCLGTTCTQEEERRNFANWFVYYRTRLHMAQASIPEAFINLDNDKIRAGLATIHQETATTIDGASSTHVTSGVRMLNTQRKADVANWIRSFRTLNNGTPLRKALIGVGDYFSRTDSGSPWATNPGAISSDANTSALACRRAYNVLVTDGYYNDTAPTTVGDVDGAATTAAISGPDAQPYTYTPRAPYIDQAATAKSATLADVAMKYWVNDLNDQLDNKVPAGPDSPGQNPAFWQHLVQFPIGLGITGSIPNDNVATQVQYVTTNGWWSASDTSLQKVDDLMHAAMNTRGQYFSARKPEELTSALSTALTRAARRNGMKQAGVTTSITTISGNNIKYIPEYTTEQWIGDVKAYATDPTTGLWSTTPKWSAAASLPAPASRNIVTVSQSGNTQSGVNFLWSSDGRPAGTSTLDFNSKPLIESNLPPGASGEDLVNFIRGDKSQEDTPQSPKLFRQRESVLGDFVNSPPLVLQGNVNLSYDLLPSTANADPGSSYKAFVTSKQNRTRLIFAGANDGMLHAFADGDAASCTTAPSPATCGQEVFAYVPKAALNKLGNLARRDYGGDANPHQYLVDGPLTESDAFLAESWRNVLIGTMGAGGRAIYALDVTPGTTLGTSSVKWEKSSDDNGAFGYMMGKAQVGVLTNGSWKVFVGNGPYSALGKAALMVIDLDSEGAINAIVAQTDVNDTGNGLGAVRLVKDSGQRVIGAYAGDLKGRLWHFDLSTDSTAVTPTLIFTATNATGAPQPITVAPSIYPHPRGGTMVTFGTGKLFDDADSDDSSQQTIYGVWHKPAATSPATRNNLAPQTIVTEPVVNNNRGKYFKLTYQNVDYTTQRGWYIDLTLAAGQRVIYPPTAEKNFVVVNTVVPVSTAQATTCDNNGQGFGFLLPVLMDGMYDKSTVLDTNGDGLINGSDAAGVRVYDTKATGNGTTLTNSGGTDGDAPPPPCTTNCPPTPQPRCKGSVRLVYTDDEECGQLGSWKRTWRQLHNTPRP